MEIFSWIQRFPHAPWAYAAETLASFINLSDIPLGLTVQLRLDGFLRSSPVLFGLRFRGPVLDSIGVYVLIVQLILIISMGQSDKEPQKKLAPKVNSTYVHI